MSIETELVNRLPIIIYCDGKRYKRKIEVYPKFTTIDYEDDKKHTLCHSIDTNLFLASYNIFEFINNNKDKIVCMYDTIKVDKDLYSEALAHFEQLPNLNEDCEIVINDCYNPTLYRHDGMWCVDWVSDEGDSVKSFEDESLVEVITKANEYFINKKFK